MVRFETFGIGGVIAVVVLILALVLVVIGRLDITTGGLIAGLAVARLT